METHQRVDRSPYSSGWRKPDASNTPYRAPLHSHRIRARRRHRHVRRPDGSLRPGRRHFRRAGHESSRLGAGGHRGSCGNCRRIDRHGPGRLPRRAHRHRTLQFRARARNSRDRRIARHRSRGSRQGFPRLRIDRGRNGACGEGDYRKPKGLGRFHDAVRAGPGRAGTQARAHQRADHCACLTSSAE